MESEMLKPLSSVGNIDKHWIEKMLSKKFGIPVTVHSLGSQLPRDREGFLSEIAFLKIVYSKVNTEQIPLQLVLKVLPKDPKLRQFMANGGLAKREVEFYKFISKKEFLDLCTKRSLVLPVPETYFTDFREDAISIVLRDLSVDGYKSVIVKDGSSLDQVKVALQAIAKIHAAGILYIKEYGEVNENLASLSTPLDFAFYDQFLIPNMKILRDMTKDTPFSQTVRSLEPSCRLMLSICKRYPLIKTVIHGDLWAGQLLYSDDESKAVTIDWQFCRVDNPATDILSMLFMSCDPKVLENNLDDILSYYWQAFNSTIEAAGISLDVTYDQFKANIEDLLIYGFVFLVISLHDFIDGDSITNERVLGALKFLEERRTFAKFFQLIESGDLS